MLRRHFPRHGLSVDLPETDFIVKLQIQILLYINSPPSSVSLQAIVLSIAFFPHNLLTTASLPFPFCLCTWLFLPLCTAPRSNFSLRGRHRDLDRPAVFPFATAESRGWDSFPLVPRLSVSIFYALSLPSFLEPCSHFFLFLDLALALWSSCPEESGFLGIGGWSVLCWSWKFPHKTYMRFLCLPWRGIPGLVPFLPTFWVQGSFLASAVKFLISSSSFDPELKALAGFALFLRELEN